MTKELYNLEYSAQVEWQFIALLNPFWSLRQDKKAKSLFQALVNFEIFGCLT